MPKKKAMGKSAVFGLDDVREDKETLFRGPRNEKDAHQASSKHSSYTNTMISSAGVE